MIARCLWLVSLVSIGIGLTTSARAADETIVKLGKLSAAVPATWKSEKPINRLRSHQFKLPSGQEGVPDAEVVVSPESSPDFAKQFPRWKAQFTPPEGKTLDDISKESKREQPGVVLHFLDVQGTWKFKERPFDPKSKEETRPDSRVVWVIVLSGDDSTHVRITGPQIVVDKYYEGFDLWLKSLK